MPQGRERIESEQEMREWLQEAVTGLCETREDDDPGCDLPEINPVSFSDQGVLTKNEGIVIAFPDGREFQITIVRSKTAE